MLTSIKEKVEKLPFFGPIAIILYRKLRGVNKIEFETSDQYWEDRYRAGLTSGSGSYGRLAQFKADFLNNFVLKHSISNILEFGCGDGSQLELSIYQNYVGFDVAPTSISLCREKFANNPNYSFHLVGSDVFKYIDQADLVLSLDVIYHLIEDDVFENYMNKLFKSSSRFVIIYSYDYEKHYSSKHELGRNFTKWISNNIADWKLVEKVSSKYPYEPSNPNNTSKSEFFVFKKVC